VLLQATFLYASLLRQLGHQGVQDMLGLSPGSTALPPDSEAAATVLAAAATQLRQVRLIFTVQCMLRSAVL
jgi:hypothetical protein